MNRLFPLIILIILLHTTACTRGDGEYKLPGVYRINVQQGNIVDQNMIDRLKPGMPKNQVKIIMGTPTLDDTFHPDRWDYIYTFSYAGSRRSQRHLVIYFKNDKLAYLNGDVVTSNRKPQEYALNSKIVDVPLREQKQAGWFGKFLDKLPFVGNKEPTPPKGATNIEANNPNPTAHQPAQLEQSSASGTGSGTDSGNGTDSGTDSGNGTDSGSGKAAAKKDQPKEKGFFSRMLDKLPFVGNHQGEDSGSSSGK